MARDTYIRDPEIDGVLEDYFAEQQLALILLSDALPASMYFPGEEGHIFRGEDTDQPASAPHLQNKSK